MHRVRVHEDFDTDAYGEEVEEDDAEDALVLYCFCDKQSYGFQVVRKFPYFPYSCFISNHD